MTGEIIPDGKGATILVEFHDGRGPLALDMTDEDLERLPPASLLSPPAPAKTYSVEEIREKHPHAYKRWTPEEEHELRKLAEQGLTPRDMAARLHRQVGGVRSRLRRLGLIE